MNLDRIKAFYLQGDYKSAITEGEKLIAVSGQDSRGLDELYYLLGVSYLKDGNYLRACDIFEIILNECAGSKFHDEALLGLGDTYYLRGQYQDAQANYARLVDKTDRLKAAVYWRLSQCAYKLGDPEQGAQYLDRLKDDYPMNPELVCIHEPYLLSEDNKAYYAVQTGAFSSKERAESLKNKLISEGHSAYVEQVDASSAVSYRVRVGKFSKRQEAVELEGKLMHEGYPTRICP